MESRESVVGDVRESQIIIPYRRRQLEAWPAKR